MSEHAEVLKSLARPELYEGPQSSIDEIIGAAAQPRRSGRVDELQDQVEKLMSKLRIAVVHGGDKNAEGAVLYRAHNARSWKSYETVARDIAASLERLGAQNVAVLPEDMRLAERLRDLGVQFVWLNTGGVQGQAPCAHAAAMLEMLGVPYVGHDPMTASILDAKHTFKRLMVGAGVPTADFITWHGAKGAFQPAKNERFQRVFGDSVGPFIVKPVSGRASLHVEYVEHISMLGDVVDEVFEITQNDVLIERFLSGREFCVAAAGDVVARNGELRRLEDPFIFSFVERVLSADERVFTSMDKKAITGERIRNLDPSKDNEQIVKLTELARRVSHELNLESLVRLDVRADANGKLHVLEANPKPDLKAPTVSGVISIVSAGAAQCGMSYDDLILSLIAHRVDTLLSKRSESVKHLLDLLRG